MAPWPDLQDLVRGGGQQKGGHAIEGHPGQDEGTVHKTCEGEDSKTGLQVCNRSLFQPAHS